MNVMKLFASAARSWPDKPALFAGTRCLLNYGQLLRRVGQRAGWLRSLGCGPGDHLVLCMGNCPAYLELMYAGIWAGMTVVPVNAKLHPREIEYVAGHCAASIVVSDRAGQLTLPAGVLSFDVGRLPDVQGMDAVDLQASLPDDVAWLFYTSGTTGRPKGAMLTHRNLVAMTLSYRSDVEAVDGQDAYLYAAPISHGAGLYTFAYSVSAARHVVPESGGFDAAEVLDLAAGMGELCMFAAPTMLGRLVAEADRRGGQPLGFKSIVYGGGPMYLADLQRALHVMGPCLAQIYGQGETPMTITCVTRTELRAFAKAGDQELLGSVGRSHSLVEVEVVDGQDRPCAAGELGEIRVRGATVMLGYLGDEQATAGALRDGWLYTGDIGSFDGRGFLTLRDRSKDVIISGGSNIYPREVEEVLLQHPSVREVSVIGAHDPEWGEKVVAFIVATPGSASDAELDELCLSRFARFKRPKEYVRLPSLPKNNNGKVLKTELRDIHAQRAKRGGGGA